MTTTTETTFTTIGALKEFLKDLPDDLEISVDCVGETGYLDGPVKMIKTVWEYDNKKNL